MNRQKTCRATINTNLGHFVNECPTNDDPDYDIPPSRDYRCKFCKKPGVHYFLFCPQNPNPNSIYRRRQAKMRSNGPSSPDRGLKRSPSPSWEVSEDHKIRKLSYDNDRGYASLEPELGDDMKLCSPRQQSRLRLSPYDMQGKDEFREGRKDIFVTDVQANTLTADKTVSMPPTNENLVQNDTIVRDFAHFEQDGILKSKDLGLKSSQMEWLRK